MAQDTVETEVVEVLEVAEPLVVKVVLEHQVTVEVPQDFQDLTQCRPVDHRVMALA